MLNIDIGYVRGRTAAFAIEQLVQFERNLDDELEAAMQDSVQWVERDAKGRAPTDTGALRASLAGMVKPTVDDAVKGYVGSNLKYSKFQEFGTSKMGAQPYLRPAIEANRDRIKKRFEQAVHDAARGLF
jgi:HK97 gp10 family phage protein